MSKHFDHRTLYKRIHLANHIPVKQTKKQTTIKPRKFIMLAYQSGLPCIDEYSSNEIIAILGFTFLDFHANKTPIIKL